MADPKKDIQEINKEIAALRKQLGETSSKIFDEKDLETAQRYLQGLRAEVREMGSDLDYISKSFKDSVNELSRQNTYLAASRKALNQISDISRSITEFRKGDKTLTEKQLKDLQIQAKTRFDELKLAARSGTLSRENREEIQAALNEEEAFNKAVENTIKAQQGVNKEIGLSGKALEGAGKFLEKMGFSEVSQSISESIQKTKDARLQYNLNQDAISQIKDEYSQLGPMDIERKRELRSQLEYYNKQNQELEGQSNKYKNILGSLKEQFSVINMLEGAMVLLIDALKITDSETGDMAKSMNLTYSEALNVRRELGDIGALSMDAAVTTKGLQESYVAIGQSLGSNAMASEDTLKTFTKLREQAGYTNEQLAELNKLSLVNGKSLEQNTEEILGGAKAYASRRGLIINEKQVLNDVVNASATLKLSLGGSADKLAEAAVKTRAVGINLETAANMAEQLLDFESSIENELSAELLLGKDLNFEKARQLALNNDIAGAAEEIAKQVGTSADFANMNAIQQEAIAKAAGMTKEQLAQSLMDREALAKLSGVEGKDAKEKFDNLVKQVGLEEAKKRLGNDQLANQYAQQSVQERFTQAVEKLKEVFIQVAEPILAIVSPLMNLVSAVLPAINVLLQPIVFAAQLLADTFSYVSELITSSTPALVAFGAVLSGILITQQAIAFQNEQGFLFATYTYAMKQKDLAISGLINAKEMIGSAIAKKGLILGIAEAAMGAFKAMTAIPIVGPVLGAAAAASAVALGYSLMKGNDIMSPGDGSSGYGKRTLFGPEGAIQLNNKDTVIAGTNLFDKADDMVSAPKGAISVSNSTAPKNETPVDPNAGTNARLDALIAATGRVNAIPTLKIQ